MFIKELEKYSWHLQYRKNLEEVNKFFESSFIKLIVNKWALLCYNIRLHEKEISKILKIKLRKYIEEVIINIVRLDRNQGKWMKYK